MADAHGSSLREHLTLFVRFLRSPRTVGAVSASSQVLVRGLLNDLKLRSPMRVVELGPGTGALTGAIFRQLTPADRFFAIDIDPLFVGRIKTRWPDVDCVCASAEDIESLARDRDMLPLDHVLSALPFTSLPIDMSERILDGVVRSLRPGGTFTTFQYIYSYNMAPTKAFRDKMSERMGRQPRRHFVLRNLPPAWVLTWQKS